ncbi:MAG: hypothetical protein HOW73_43325 [Polyangiaceae bacterium]|nr:hypothetical protein [Polyangiaceae bacterium]
MSASVVWSDAEGNWTDVRGDVSGWRLVRTSRRELRAEVRRADALGDESWQTADPGAEAAILKQAVLHLLESPKC